MDGYIKKSEAVDVIVKYPYDIAGKTATAIKMIEDLPSADVVPKSEVERLTIEFDAIRGAANSLKMHYEKVEAEIERLKKYNTDVAFKHYNDGKADIASEIFAEIENLFLNNYIESFKNIHDNWIYRFKVNMMTEIAELKKKYTEGEDKPASEEKYFSPGDVAKMTHQEVREKYTAIRRSMERW